MLTILSGSVAWPQTIFITQLASIYGQEIHHLRLVLFSRLNASASGFGPLKEPRTIRITHLASPFEQWVHLEAGALLQQFVPQLFPTTWVQPGNVML